MATKNRNNARGGVATANRPRKPANNNQAIQPQAEVVESAVLVQTPDFQVDAFPDDDGTIQELPDDPDDPNGLRVEMDVDDDSPVFDMKGNPVESVVDFDRADGRDPDDFVDSFVGDASVDDDEPDDGEPNAVLDQARLMMAEAQRMMAEANQRMALAQQVAAAPSVSARRPGILARHQQAAPVETNDPVIVGNVERTRIVRTREDVGPVHYGSPGNGGIVIDLKKGKKYRVPESVYTYLLERDLIWSMS